MQVLMSCRVGASSRSNQEGFAEGPGRGVVMLRSIALGLRLTALASGRPAAVLFEMESMQEAVKDRCHQDANATEQRETAVQGIGRSEQLPGRGFDAVHR